jgi:DtxR family Mn-dependent transcriptional regulator
MATGPHRTSHTGSTEAVEDYAKAIYSLQARCDGEPVQSGDVAARLGVTPASASGMIKKLAELGLVDHLPYKGVALTESGERLALEVLRHHRLLELFLADELGMAWDLVHDEAEALEHVISPELERLIAKKLGNPTRDPHGDPIPSAALEIDDAARTHSLDALAAGDRGRFVRVSDSDGEMLRWLDEQGIALGAEVEVRGRQPFGGPVLVAIDGDEHALGGSLAAAMRVELA